MQNNPWIGVALVALGLIATVVFAKTGINAAAGATGLVTLGVAILNGTNHANAVQDVKTTRKLLAVAQQESLRKDEIK